MARPRKPGSGGHRDGAQGTAYANRSDLNAQPVRTAPNQTYGVAGQQQAAQQAIPLPQAPMPGPLTGPSNRPSEPLTAGIASGPGAGPEALGPTPGMDTSLEGTLRGLYRAYPNSDLAKLVASLDLRGR